MNNLFRYVTMVFVILANGYSSLAHDPGWRGMPVILRLSDAVSPGKAFSVNGFGFTDDGALEIALEKNTNGVCPAAPSLRAVTPGIIQRDRNGNFIVAIMPAKLQPGVYNIWVRNRYGWSAPKKMNAARALFISEREAFRGLFIKIAGRNLACKEFGVTKNIIKTRVRLNNNANDVFEMVRDSLQPLLRDV